MAIYLTEDEYSFLCERCAAELVDAVQSCVEETVRQPVILDACVAREHVCEMVRTLITHGADVWPDYTQEAERH